MKVLQSVSYKRYFRCNNCFLLLVYTIHLSLSTDLEDPPPMGTIYIKHPLAKCLNFPLSLRLIKLTLVCRRHQILQDAQETEHLRLLLPLRHPAVQGGLRHHGRRQGRTHLRLRPYRESIFIKLKRIFQMPKIYLSLLKMCF